VNGRSFRANVQVIPSVFKGNKCLQLWVHPLNKFELNKMENDSQSPAKKRIEELIPFESPNTDKILVSKKVTSSSILRGIIKRKEATISAQKLVEMKINEGRRNKKLLSHILSLKVPIAQRVGIDDLLFSSSVMHQKEKRLIFWDKVKLTRLLQILMKKKQLDVNLYVRISEASVVDKPFAEWFLPGLKRIGNKASHLTFLMPPQISESQVQPFMKLVDGLRSTNCQIALDNFSVSKQSLTLLKHAKPDCVRLSLPWVREIEGNAKRELALGSLVRQLESKNIKVIAPCGFSADMRKLFALSGVSFCQERTLKTG
jgi:EAL domain-containing protein (putative c-di-GMP-specific phosphodiesterase class I)